MNVEYKIDLSQERKKKLMNYIFLNPFQNIAHLLRIMFFHMIIRILNDLSQKLKITYIEKLIFHSLRPKNGNGSFGGGGVCMSLTRNNPNVCRDTLFTENLVAKKNINIYTHI